MKTIVSEGKNVEKAIEAGLVELGVSQEEVSIKILSEGGLFKKAKVELTVDKEAESKVKIKEEKEDKKAEKETAKETKKKEIAETKKPKKEVVEEVKEEPKEEKVSKKSKDELLDEAIELGSKFLTSLFKELNDEIIITSTKNDGNICYNIKGEKVSTFIGYRGETLNALQYIVNMVIKNAGYRARVLLDVENYKAKREETHISLAERLARKAIAQNKEIKLEPMNAYERRIIHTALTDKDVSTHSEGEEPNRYLVITPNSLKTEE